MGPDDASVGSRTNDGPPEGRAVESYRSLFGDAVQIGVTFAAAGPLGPCSAS
jgi:hypothetical protein